MGDTKTGQVSENAAKIYEEIYVPSLFEKWAPVVADAADIQGWHTVLDVACGTGLLAITVSGTNRPRSRFHTKIPVLTACCANSV